MKPGDTSQTVTVKVTAADGSIPSGKIDLVFNDRADETADHTLDSTGQTVFTLYSTPAGTYQIHANYPAQGNYNQSATPDQTLTVSNSPPPPPSAVLQTVSFDVGARTFTVTYKDGTGVHTVNANLP